MITYPVDLVFIDIDHTISHTIDKLAYTTHNTDGIFNRFVTVFANRAVT
jgi:hypothetical protein